MAWIETRGDTYLVRWREPGGKVASARRRTRDEARQLKAEMEAQILRGSYVVQEIRRIPFLIYAQRVLDSDFNLAKATRANYDSCLRLQLAPLAQVPVENVDSDRVRRLFAGLGAADASAHTLSMTRKVLSKVCSVAVEDGILSRNPARSVRLSKPARRQLRPLTPEQVQEAAEAVSGRWRAAVLLAAWGGLRIGEVGALRREDVDWERGSVRISSSVSRFGLKEAKTRSSHRVVTLPDWVMGELAEHVLHYAAPDGRLFLTVNGNPIYHGNVAPIMRKTGIRFHDLRHTHAALLIREGVHPRAIQERMGHSSITTTMDVYGHLFEGAHDGLARTLERFKPEEGKVIELSGNSRETDI